MVFNFLKKEKKCPTCGMDIKNGGVAKYGEKFCSDNCLKAYEKENQIAGSDCGSKKGGGCCCG